MYLRLLSVLGLVVFVVFSSNSVYGQSCSANPKTESFLYNCSSTVQTCPAVHTINYTNTRTGPVSLKYTVSPLHCSSVRVHAKVGGNTVATTPYMGWSATPWYAAGAGPLDATIQLGTLNPGTHTITLEAEGKTGSCNFGFIFAWGGTVHIESQCSEMSQCSDGIDNDGDGKIDFVCPAGGTPYRPEESKWRESATFTAGQWVFEEMAPNGQARRPTLISSKVNPGDKVKVVSVSNNKFSISVGKGANYERTCDYGTLSFVNANERTLENRQLRNINNAGVIAPPWTNRAFISFDDNPQEYSDNSGYNSNNGYNPCQVTIEVFSPAVGTPGTTTACTPDPDCSSATDNTEAPEVNECSDGIDNDTDGFIDFPADTGCTSATDTTEENTALAQCFDTLDNDGDGKIDFGGANPDPDCSSATDNTESGDLTCPAGQSRKPTPESPVCILTASPTTSPAGTIFVLTGYEHLTGNCTLAGMTAHIPPVAITPTLPLTTLTVSPTLLTVSATSTGSFTWADVVARLLTCPAGNSTCSIGTGGVITCGCYNAIVTPPASSSYSAQDFPGEFTNNATINLSTYDTQYDNWTLRIATDGSGNHNIKVWTLTVTGGPANNGDDPYLEIRKDRKCRTGLGFFGPLVPYSVQWNEWSNCPTDFSSPMVVSSNGPNSIDYVLITSQESSTIVTPPVYTCVSDRCTEGQYYCAAENTCKPANQSCSSITCNKNNVCDVNESCDCSDCTKGVPDNDKDRCWISGGQQLYCTKDSATNENIRFPFCLPACLDGQACTTTCNTQVGACCPAGSTWNSIADACVPATCGKGQFYCAHQQKCLPGGTTCDTTVCNNDGTCSGDESCQCADCVNGGPDDKDKCSIIGGVQALCSDDNLTDGKPGACCVPPEKWDSAANGGVGACTACSNTQAPAELKANYDQPYITCTGNGVVSDTHFRYRITKEGSTDAPFISDIFANSAQVLHPKMPIGNYTVQCFYGNATTVNTTGAALPHTCEKRMQVKDVNENMVQGCNRIYAYKWQTLSDEMTSNTTFDASFRCGARLAAVTPTNPFALHIGAIAPQFLMADWSMTAFLALYELGAISTQTQAHTFNTGSVPVACAVMVGGGYSTNDYCRLTACVGDNCNVPKAFSVVHSGDKVCTTDPTDTYTIGCNPDAPEDVRLACVEMFEEALRNTTPAPANGVPFRVKLNVNGSIPSNGAGVECTKWAPGTMPGGYNIYGTISCTQLLPNGEFYEIYAADTTGSPINSLQSKGRTVEMDNEIPKLETIKYYTDSSLTTEVVPTKWSNKPVYAVAICNDTPRSESLSCACAPTVDWVTTTQPLTWTPGIQHGGVDIGADLLRYTRVISENLTGAQSIGVIDTAGNKSPTQTITVSIDTKAPVMVAEESWTGTTRSVTLTATDNASKIWKNTLAPTSPTGMNSGGLVYRKGLKANLDSLTFDAECDLGPSDGFFANVGDTGLQETATVTIPDVNTTTEVVTYCIRDNAGNTTRGIYPVITDACFSASNMSPIPNFDTYRGITSTRLASTTFTANQKYGYSFSENTTNAACFRGILATNIQTLVANQLNPLTTTTLTSWESDRAPTKANTSVLNTNGYYYYRYTSSSGNTLSLTTSPTGTGTKSVIVEGGNIHIKANMNYSGTGKSLILIARKNSSGYGGDITIDPSVTNIDAILIADGGALKSVDTTTPGDRLTINGRIYSYNTRGGSLKPSWATDVMNSDTPKIFSSSGVLTDMALGEAQRQDLERLRPSFVDSDNACSLQLNYFAYTTSTLPVLLQRPVGYTGGNCAF